MNLALLRTMAMLVAGSGPLAEWLGAAAESRMPGRVCALGQVSSRRRLAEIYANCLSMICSGVPNRLVIHLVTFFRQLLTRRRNRYRSISCQPPSCSVIALRIY